MSRPPLEVADLIRTAGTAFIERNRAWIRWSHIKVLLAIARCRTAALGGHIDECVRCGHRATISPVGFLKRQFASRVTPPAIASVQVMPRLENFPNLQRSFKIPLTNRWPSM